MHLVPVNNAYHLKLIQSMILIVEHATSTNLLLTLMLRIISVIIILTTKYLVMINECCINMAYNKPNGPVNTLLIQILNTLCTEIIMINNDSMQHIYYIWITLYIKNELITTNTILLFVIHINCIVPYDNHDIINNNLLLFI